MSNLANSATQIDLQAFAGRIDAFLNEHHITHRDVEELTGVSVRQVSCARRGLPIATGATYMLCTLLNIEICDLLSPEIVKRVCAIKKDYEEQCDTLLVSCETAPRSDLADPVDLPDNVVELRPGGRDAKHNRN